MAHSTISFGQLRSGGFGNFFIGGFYNIHPSLQENLRAADLLGSSAKISIFTSGFGGSGFALRPRGVLLGGSGFTYDVTTSTDRGTAKAVVSGGFFDIGYAVLRSDNIFAFPYFGIGGIGANVKITNTLTDQTLNFGGDKIHSGSSASYTAGGIAFEAGFSVKFVIDRFYEMPQTRPRIGLILGLDAGATIFSSMMRWQNNATDREITAYSRPFILSPYIRATIGMSILKDVVAP